MDLQLTTLQWIFLTIPESIALACLAVVLAGQVLHPRNVFKIGLIYAVFVYIIRFSSLAFGVHTILLIIILALLIHRVLKLKLSRSLFTALVSMIILAVLEGMFLNIIYSLTGTTLVEVREELMLWVLYGMPHTVSLFLLAFVIYKWRK